MADEENKEQEELKPDQAGASDEVAEEAEEPAATPEPEPDGPGAEGEEPAEDSVAEEAEEPAATPEPEPDGPGAEGEEPAEDSADEPAAKAAPAEEESEAPPGPKQIRRQKRSQFKGPAKPERSAEDRASERAEGRRRSAADRRRYRASTRQRGGEPGTGTTPAEGGAGPKKVRTGTVVSTKAAKTITVKIEVTRRHPTYEKVVRRSATLHAHDESGQAQEGDVVRVVETRPLSRTKRWRLVEVLERAR